MAFTSTPPRKYDVFLSFRGEDTREGFTERLYQKLRWYKFYVFKDDAEPERGITLSKKLLRAIEESKTAVVVISPNFASSTWCLDELVKILGCMEARDTILPVFYDVDPSHVRHQRGSFAGAFEKHEERFKEDLLKVQLWRDSLTKLANFVGWASKNYSSEVELLDEIVEQVQNKVDPAWTLLGSKEKLVGIDSQLKTIIRNLEPETNDVRFLGLYGMGGIGKSTLARLVYERVSHNFQVSCFLADVKNVSEKLSLVYLQNQLLSQILKENLVQVCDVYGGTSDIKHYLNNKKVLLILDDVDHMADQLETLAGMRDWFGKGSIIIITTKDHHQVLHCHGVDMMIYKPELQTWEESFQLFIRKAFRRDEPVEDYFELSFRFLKHCHGHSLALKILGTFLYNKGLDIWNSTLDKLAADPERSIFSLLKMCYDGLNETEKRIFLDVACFFKGEPKERVIKILDCYFGGANCMIVDALVEKSFLTISHNNCVEMHDLIQELGWKIVHEECPEEPGRRSRLWRHEDIMEVLALNKGTEAIEGILLNLPDDHQSTMAVEHLNPEAFSKMSNLRFLKIDNLRMSLPLISKNLPNSLRHFEWSCSFPKALPPRTPPDVWEGRQSEVRSSFKHKRSICCRATLFVSFFIIFVFVAKHYGSDLSRCCTRLSASG